MSAEYEWAPGSPFRGDPAEVGRELDAIHNTGGLTPEAVVTAAKPKNAPLHKYIYDRTTEADALLKHRHERARKLIKAIVQVAREPDPSTGETVTAVVHGYHLVTTEQATRVYVPAAVARANPIYSEQVKQRLLRDMRALKRQLDQWGVYAELAEALERALAA